MSAPGEPSLDFGFPDVEVEYVASESSDQRGWMRLPDNSLRPSTVNVSREVDSLVWLLMLASI